MDALCKFHDFTTSMEFELDFIIPCRSMINGLFKADERVYHFARQNEADPHTKYERESRHNAQAPLSTMNQLAGFLVIQLDAPAWSSRARSNNGRSLHSSASTRSIGRRRPWRRMRSLLR